MREQSTTEHAEFVGLRFIHQVYKDPRAPLVVLVHGRAGNAQVMWGFGRLIPEGSNVVSFEAFLPDALGGFSWWDMASSEPREVAILRARDRLLFAIERYIELMELSPSKVIAFGFSQGAVLLSAMMLTGVMHFDGVGLLAGLVSKAGGQPKVIGHPEIFMAHGTADQVLPIEGARAGAERLRSLGLNVEYVEEDVGHKVGVQGTRALKEWLERLCG